MIKTDLDLEFARLFYLYLDGKASAMESLFVEMYLDDVNDRMKEVATLTEGITDEQIKEVTEMLKSGYNKKVEYSGRGIRLYNDDSAYVEVAPFFKVHRNDDHTAGTGEQQEGGAGMT